MTPEEAAAFLKAMKRAADSVAVALAPFAAAYVRFGLAVYALMWHSYILNGAPYGETRKGLERWLKEQRLLNS